ncbi:hypothetical protein A499_19041 [Niallia nealsonii AAU1]|nr:hypothetical protein A499_19041 [Niallia nealsonii AAU1]
MKRLKLSPTESEVYFRLRVIATNFTKTAFYFNKPFIHFLFSFLMFSPFFLCFIQCKVAHRRRKHRYEQ